MPDKGEQGKEHSKITVRIGDVQVELEGTRENIKKLMDKDLYNFAKGLEETKTQPSATPTETVPRTTLKTTAKTPEAPKEKTSAPPPPSKSSTPSSPPSQPSRSPAIGKKPAKTGKKRMSWRPVAIALVMVSIMLTAALTGVLAVYLPMADDLQSQIADKNDEVADLEMEISSLNSQVASLNGTIEENDLTIANLQDGVDILNSQIQSYLNIIYLNVSGYLFSDLGVSQNQSESSVVYQNQLDYTGYATISVQSTSNTTYVQMLYSSYGVNFNQNVTVGTDGTASFPILPGAVEIRIGNLDADTGDLVNATASAIYRY
jgi:cell division protein FtsB